MSRPTTEQEAAALVAARLADLTHPGHAAVLAALRDTEAQP